MACYDLFPRKKRRSLFFSRLKLFLPQFFFSSQTQRVAHRDGCPSNGLRAQRAVPFLHPRGRIRVTEGARRVPASVGPRRRSVQFVFSLEGHRRVHQHVLLVPGMRHVTRRPSAQVLQGRK